MDMQLPAPIAALFEGREDYLCWAEDVEGTHIEGGVLTLGCRSGPDVVFHSLLHEMAHFIEIDDARCHLRGWGLRLGQVEIAGRMYDEPRTYQATMREVRVCGIQSHLTAMAGDTMDLAGWAGILVRLMPDQYCFSTRFTHGRDFTREDRIRTLVREMEDAAARWDQEGVLREWSRKCGILRTRSLSGRMHPRQGKIRR